MAAAGSIQQDPRPPQAHPPFNHSSANEHLYPVRSTMTGQPGKCRKWSSRIQMTDDRKKYEDK
ncbi:MAG: hypothetical protein HF976_06585 [ANME-2 cluster archaeon]|nr:hypothetical protein [ANME-2 cluster archaeon]MBC2701067.1 hypothetical protein [ANME-2 cluster archaeon]MBC2707498.1 hypothetical protein [ANME-2 cluster archaeon]MBC2748099.1 hypothetical protein [ANME-2 cluster archaeon]MBC2762638.1 hypothetical protein [ANME-2 cluster archaeon]